MKKIMITLTFILSIIILTQTSKVFAETSYNTGILNEELTYKTLENGEILISGFKIEEKVSEVLNRKFGEEYEIKIKNNKGIDITSELETKIGTGNKIELYSKTGENVDDLNTNLKETYTAIIYGDTNGDGTVGAVDALAIVKNKIGKEEFNNKATEEAGRVLSNTRESGAVPKADDALYVVKHKLNPEQYPIDQKMPGTNKGEEIINEYTVNFNSNGGTVTVETKKVIQDTQYGELPIPTKEGYKFIGWFTQENAGTKIESNTIVNITENQTLYAHWENDKYTLTIKHYLENANDTSYTLNKTTTTENISYGTQIELANYKTTIENGTYKQGALTENGTANTTTTLEGNTTIYLYYSRNRYILTLNAGNYIETTTGAGTYKVGQNVTINATLKVNETGYTNKWVNWTSNNTSLLANNNTQNATITMPAGNVSLTANGTKAIQTYTITYNANGGTGAPSSQTKNYGENLVLTNEEPSREDYFFMGWATYNTENFKSRTYLPGDLYKVDESITLYATWISSQVQLDYGSFAWNDSNPPRVHLIMDIPVTVYYETNVYLNILSEYNSNPIPIQRGFVEVICNDKGYYLDRIDLGETSSYGTGSIELPEGGWWLFQPMGFEVQDYYSLRTNFRITDIVDEFGHHYDFSR